MIGIRKLEKSIRILLAGVLLSHLGTYLVTPLLPIMLSLEAGLAVGRIGIVLASNAISFQFGSIVGGVLADRVGRRLIIGLGAFIGMLGLIGFGFFRDYWLLLLSAITLGFGNGLNAPSTKAAISVLAAEENRTTAFSLRGIAANIGTGTAGIVIFFFITGSSQIIFFIAAAVYLLLALMSWTLLPKHCGNEPCPEMPLGAYKEVFQNKSFLVFGFVSIFIWALYTQLALVLPLRAADVLANPSNVALIWTINSIIVISTQSLITNKFILHRHPLTAMGIGMVFIGLGLGSLYFASSFIHLVFSAATFVIGEMLVLPTTDSTISQLSKAQLIGIFFGLANVIFGLGQAGGNFVGGQLLSGSEDYPLLPWLVYAIIGVVMGILIIMLKKWKPLNDSLKSAAQKDGSPKHAPKVSVDSSQHKTHPFNSWEPEVFFRKRTDP
ncbi:MFS transporter [Bacillus carboniphilus]|uniref:MFS transporter n=2 Tax=Bacillus carboniphilus TaxID=86663 RepID=A0ABP3FZE5_9BACI